ncbi:hypothetical protein, partial [Streptomyces griseus]|uniref:hypothetical protein n=1 Tax=Streptomyces griseus TaxID=1911 RepID=UPI001C4019EF
GGRSSAAALIVTEIVRARNLLARMRNFTASVFAPLPSSDARAGPVLTSRTPVPGALVCGYRTGFRELAVLVEETP